MNRRPEENLEALVSRSTLMPTAGEFVPLAYRQQAPFQIFNNTDHGPENYQSLGRPTSLEFQRNNEANHNKGDRERRREGQNSRGNTSWRNGRRQDNWRESSQPHSSHSRYRRSDEVEDLPNNYRDSPRAHNNQRVDNRSFYPSNAERLEESNNGSRNRRFQNDSYYKRNQYGNRAIYVGDKNRQDKNKGEKADKDTNSNQMDVLIKFLCKGSLECLVCYEHVKQSQATWNCAICHHVLHLKCITKWALSSRDEEGWRCPACQHVSDLVPTEYSCFCGKTVDPVWDRNDCPHSCGSMCGRQRAAPCPHKCTLLCHPGPCPPCQLFYTRKCGCGRVSRTVQCTETDPILCSAICGRTLNCGLHKCEQVCHNEDCLPCDKTVKQVCFCEKSEEEVICTIDSVGVLTFCCGKVCSKKLDCNNHECLLLCHEGSCPSCPLQPEFAIMCPCGQNKLSDLSKDVRTSCLEPIPTCEEPCMKFLSCGEPGNRHQCKSRCHEGTCPPCPGTTMVRCRCGHMKKTLSCADFAIRGDDVRCEKKCFKLKSCGKHKCREVCCIDVDHICTLPCSRTMSCGLHPCEETCHSAYCRPCPRVSFEEQYCACGVAVIYPPIACGTPPPKCTQPCSRVHPCGHPPDHSCHSCPVCPPCTTLIAKYCHGGHELRKAVLCHQDAFSCGLPCGKPLPCGRHNCIVPCHDGPCLKQNQECTQPCSVSRSTCGHSCSAPCHQPPCPETPCKEMVKVTCECGHRFSTRACVDNAKEYQRIAIAQLASKMADLAAGQTIDVGEVSNSKRLSYKTLECNEECKLIERNRRLAVVLQIRNPDLSAKLTPRYSDFLRGWAKKDPRFCQMVHEKLTDLVQLAKQSKQKSRSYSFDPMNRDKRHFIYDYCEHFGCEAVAYDQEPKRNIVATALRDKSWLPGVSLLELIEREKGNRKVPLPSNSKMAPTLRQMDVLPRKSSGPLTSAWATPRGWSETAPSTSLASASSQRNNFNSSSTQSSVGNSSVPPSNFDYFDMTSGS